MDDVFLSIVLLGGNLMQAFIHCYHDTSTAIKDVKKKFLADQPIREIYFGR